MLGLSPVFVSEQDWVGNGVKTAIQSMAPFYPKSIQVIICYSNNNFLPPLLTSEALPFFPSFFFFFSFALPVGICHLCPAIQPDLQATPRMAA